jgi:hypothetical protein
MIYKFKVDNNFTVIVYCDSTIIKIIKDNEVLREINPICRYGFNNTELVFKNEYNNEIVMCCREFKVIYYINVNNFEIIYCYFSEYIESNNWVSIRRLNILPGRVTKNQWNITFEKMIKKEIIDKDNFVDSKLKNKTFFVNHRNIEKKKNYIRSLNNRLQEQANILFDQSSIDYSYIDMWNSIQKYILNSNESNLFKIERYYGCAGCNYSVLGCGSCNDKTIFRFVYHKCKYCSTRWMRSEFLKVHKCYYCDNNYRPYVTLKDEYDKKIKFIIKEDKVLEEVIKSPRKIEVMDYIIKERQKYISEILYYELISVVFSIENKGILWEAESEKYFKQ